MIDDPEEEAWIEMEKRQNEQVRQMRVKSFEDAFEDYMKAPGPRTASDEEMRRHFQAGWVVGIRNEWAKERND